MTAQQVSPVAGPASDQPTQWRAELNVLLAALCEERLDAAQTARLKHLVVENAEARQAYFEVLSEYVNRTLSMGARP